MGKNRKMNGFGLLMSQVFKDNPRKYGSFKDATEDAGRVWEGMGPDEKKL
jgi:hypothetical protein